MNSFISKNVSILLFIVAGFLIYSNTFEAPFVFDDGQNIKNNTYIRINEISINSLVKVVFKNGSFSIRSIPQITFALNYYFHQYNLKGYHVVNIIIHILTGILLYFFLKITLSISTLQFKYNNPGLISFFSTMIWLVHPLHTQSVTYIVQRMNSMSAMFYLLSMLLYATGRMHLEKQRSQNLQHKTEYRFCLVSSLYFLSAVVTWLMALVSKENAAILPFFIFLYEWYFFQDLDREWLKRNMKIVFAAIVLFGLTAFVFLGTSPLEKFKSLHDFASHDFTFMERILTQPRVVIHYLSLLFYPHPSRLNIDYDFPLSHSFIDPVTTILSIVSIIGFIYLSVCWTKQERFLSFCVLWFFGNLIIESSIIPLAVIFEHRTYLPSMFICPLLIILGQKFIKIKSVQVALLCIITVGFAIWTYQRNSVWSDSFKLWSDCVKKSPQKARPHNNLGLALEERGLVDEAIKHYTESLRINPDYERAHNNMGNALKKQGHVDEAIKHYEEALRLKPNSKEAHSNLGIALKNKERLDGAIKHYIEALRIDPNYMEAHYNLGNALLSQGRLDEAVKYYLEAVRIEPDHVKAYNNMGNALLNDGRIDEAIKYYKEALRIQPDLEEVHYNLGFALQNQGHMNEAIKHYMEVLRINPTCVDVHTKMGHVLREQDRIDEAIKHYIEELRIKPDHVEANYTMGNILQNQGRADEAIKYYKEALRIKPDLNIARNNLGNALLVKGDVDGAIEHFRKALQINSDDTNAKNNLKKALTIQTQGQ